MTQERRTGDARRMAAPRLLVAAPASGGGKTTLACGLMRAFMDRGLRVQAAKCGPDYIDPMFHRQVVGAPSRNLDLFFMDEAQVRGLVAQGAAGADITVVEGAMGYYDGIGVGDAASAWDLARATETPAILVVDGRGRARSLAAEVRGFAGFRSPSRIAGMVLNRVSPMLYPRLRDAIQGECGIPVLGFLPSLDDCALASRHLGLVPADEVAGLQAKLGRIAAAVAEHVDLGALLAIARAAAPLASPKPAPPAPAAGAPLIAVARDEAFCFTYDDTLRLLERLGARLAFFSPLRDEALPAGTRGLYLPGGYPELHARELSENVAMRRAVRAAVAAGVPTVAECGGFMYLHEWLEDDRGERWPQAGAIAGGSFRTPRLVRFGYVDLVARGETLLAAAGDTLPAHEFHYWDSDDPGASFRARKPQSGRAWDCAHASATLYAGFPHLCLHARPQAAARFVAAAAAHPPFGGTSSARSAASSRGEEAGPGAPGSGSRPGTVALCHPERSEGSRGPSGIPGPCSGRWAGTSREVDADGASAAAAAAGALPLGRFEHGGDARDVPGLLDFSASLNPLGMPAGVRAALAAAADACEAYPDPRCRELEAALARAAGVPAGQVLACAGATDAITRACLALRPRRALVCDPCYSGYEQALGLAGAQVVRHALRAEDGFALAEDVLPRVAGVDAVFLANPNNPTGLLLDRGLLGRILEAARDAGAAVVLDESFLGFTGEPSAVALGLAARFPNLVVVRSFTKLYAMAGVRLGWLACADAGLVAACRAAGQPWAVSTPAQMAGLAALREGGFVERSRAYVAHERTRLREALSGLGLQVLPGQANYLLFRAPRPIAAPLRDRGVLVRDCGNFPGLDSRWHRVAVRTRQQDDVLLTALREVLA